MLFHDSVVLLYAKAPQAGKVNTRLIADIGVQAATALQHELIHHRLAMLSAAQLCDVRLMCAPDQQQETFLQCKSQYPIALFDQVGEDLGARMFNGASAALQDYQHCIIIGTDAPALDAVMVKQVLEILHQDNNDSNKNAADTNNAVVMVPAEDGGYVLIAMQQAHTFLFENIPWGSSEVMQQSRDVLKENSVPLKELAACWDVDRLEDYLRYRAGTD